jgi:hypothetical protein
MTVPYISLVPQLQTFRYFSHIPKLEQQFWCLCGFLNPQPRASAGQQTVEPDFDLDLFVENQYEIPFKLSISTFHVMVIPNTPPIASHKARHPWGQSSSLSVSFMAS